MQTEQYAAIKNFPQLPEQNTQPAEKKAAVEPA